MPRAADGQARCFHCGAPVEGNYREMIGWERRRSGKYGGQNQGLVAKQATGRVACNDCGYKLSKGISLGQGSLFRA